MEKEKLIKELINVKGSATEEIRKAKLLGIEAYHKELKRIDTANIEEEDDEFGDELFEDVNVDEINAGENEKRTLKSSKLPPLQRLFPLSYDPNMMDDATYSGPPSISNTTTTTTTTTTTITPTPTPTTATKKDKGKQKANPAKEGK